MQFLGNQITAVSQRNSLEVNKEKNCRRAKFKLYHER